VQGDESPDFGVPRRAPEQLVYVNPGIAMLDVVSYAETGGFGGISSTLGMLRGLDPSMAVPVVAAPNGMVCEGDRCMAVDAVDELGRPIGVDVAVANQDFAASGYWWPRFSLTFLGLSVLLTLASMRLVVPAGMRRGFLRRRSTPVAAPSTRSVAAAMPDGTVGEELPEPES